MDGSELRQMYESLKKDFENHKKDFENHVTQTDKRFTILERIVDKLKDAITSLEKTALELTIAIKGLKESLGEIKGDTKWLRRTITGSLITFGVGAFFAAIKWLVP